MISSINILCRERFKQACQCKYIITVVCEENICFQQLVVTNTGKEPIYDFMIEAQHDMLIRDLDYLSDPSYNDIDDKTYGRGQGPNGFSWITVNSIDVEGPVTRKDNDSRVNPLADTSNSNNEGQTLEIPEVKGEESHKEQPTSPSEVSSVERPRPRAPSSADIELDPPLGDSDDEEVAGDNQRQIYTEDGQTAGISPGEAPNDKRRRPSDEEFSHSCRNG